MLFAENLIIRLLSRLMIVRLSLLLLMASTAMVNAQYTYTTNNGTITITKYIGSGGDVTITNKINGFAVGTIGNGAFSNCLSLATISIPDTVTNIGSYGFSQCTNLTEIYIQGNVTNIGNGAFSNCTSLVSVYFQGNAPSIGSNSFDGASDSTIYFMTNTTGWSTNFGGRPAIQLPYTFTTNNGTITITRYTGFGSTANVPSIINRLPVTIIANGAFSGCTNLSTVTIASSVNTIYNNNFQSCTKLTAIKVDVHNSFFSSTNGVLFDKSQAFLCQYPGGKIGSYIMPNSVTTVGPYAFYSCANLTSVTIGINVTTIAGFAFLFCSTLTNITIPAKVITIGEGAFKYCHRLALINTDTNNPSYSSLDGVLLNKTHAILIQYPESKIGCYTIPSSVTNIGDYAFYGCTSLAGISVPHSVINIGTYAFCFCTGLTDVSIPDSVTSIGYGAFDSCSNLTSATIPNSITNIGNWTFHSCTSLTNVTLPNNVTYLGIQAFSCCSNLTSLCFNGCAPLVDSSCFAGDDNLTLYYYPWTTGWTGSFGGRPTQINPDYTQWLTSYGFTTSLTNDYDNDGMLNWQEFLAGTSPTNDADRFAIASMGSDANAQISWLAKSNVSYQVRKSLDLLGAWLNAPSGAGTNQQAFQTAPADGVMQYADPDYAGATNGFYRVEVVP